MDPTNKSLRFKELSKDENTILDFIQRYFDSFTISGKRLLAYSFDYSVPGKIDVAFHANKDTGFRIVVYLNKGELSLTLHFPFLIEKANLGKLYEYKTRFDSKHNYMYLKIDSDKSTVTVNCRYECKTIKQFDLRFFQSRFFDLYDFTSAEYEDLLKLATEKQDLMNERHGKQEKQADNPAIQNSEEDPYSYLDVFQPSK